MTLVVEPVTPLVDLVLHGLAHVPLAGDERLYDPRYVAWARAVLPEDAREPLAGDGPRIGADLDARGAGLAAQALVWLTDDLDAFVAATTDAGPRAIDPGARLLDVGLVGVDWLHADLALAARAFVGAREALLPELERTCVELARIAADAPGLGWPRSLRVAWALGTRGRGRAEDGAVFVGACAAWNALPPERPAVLALHEEAVLRARGDHASREWAALGAVARALAEGPEPLRREHAAWLASLELSSLLETLVRAQRVDAITARALLERPDERGERLARG